MSAEDVGPSRSTEKLAFIDPRKDFPEHDRAVRNWFTVRLRPVTEAGGYAEAGVYAWRYHGPHGSFTLYITEEVLQRNPGWALPDILEEGNAEIALRTFPGGDVALCYVDGALVLRSFPRL